MKTGLSRSLVSVPDSKLLEHFKAQPWPRLFCAIRERIPTKPGEPIEYHSQTMVVDREDIDRDLAGYVFHHYSFVGGLPVFEKYEGT